MAFVICSDPLYQKAFEPYNLKASGHTSYDATSRNTISALRHMVFNNNNVHIIFTNDFLCSSAIVLLYIVRYVTARYVFQSRQQHQRGKHVLNTYGSRPNMNSNIWSFTACLNNAISLFTLIYTKL